MDKIKRQRQIQSIRDTVGWIYRDLPWFSEEEAKVATRQRDELLAALSGWVSYSFQHSKPHSGPLSPGCLICGSGGWGCNFINGLCTRHCFYCPQDRSRKEERESNTDGITFKNPSEHISFLKIFQIRGVGFSGGEPLLVLDKLLSHITAIRQEFGNSMYLWMYTNGDGMDRGVLRKLQDAGLDEIRFDLSARKYDLAPAVLSKEFIPTVTVEIPAIPEDFDLLKGLLVEMERVGVNFLNLHQLLANEHNYKALRKRNYHFLHQPIISVFESELCALKLLLFARQHGVQLPINYCCNAYKNRFQGRDHRTRQGRAVLKGFEEITSAGYIRSFRVRDSREGIGSMVRRLEEAHCPAGLWQCNERKTEVAIHSDLLPYVDWSSADVTIVYLEPGVGLKKPEDGFVEGNLVPKNSVVYNEGGWSQVGIESWRKLCKEKMNQKDVLRFFSRNYPAGGKDTASKLQKEMRELKEIANWEELESDLPEVF
jgi:pyruvate formate-lyase activating enzyme-like uncharacterized protein